MSKNKPLPDKLSALICIALKDLRKAERSKDYKVDMSMWHAPNGVCRVCLAGAVMAFSLRMPKNVDFLNTLAPSSLFDNVETNNKLFALNHLRVGQVSSALFCLRREEIYQFDRKIPEYRPGRKNSGFYKALEKLAKDLKEAGE